MSDELVSTDDAVAELLGTTPEAPAAPDAEAESVAKAEAELAAEETGKPAEPGEKPQEAAATRSDRLQKLIDSKYGGDEEKFLEGIYQGWNSTASLAKELAEVKELVKAPKPSAPAEQQIEHPDTPWLTQEIAALDAEVTSNKQQQGQLVREGNTKQAEILQLKGEMRRADDMDKEALAAKVDRAEAALERLADRWKDLDHRNRRIDHEKRDLARQKALAEREVAAYKAEQSQLEKDDQAYQAGELKKFNDAVDEAATAFQLAPGTQREYMREVIRAEASLFLRSLPVGAPAIDLVAFVKGRAEVYADQLKLSKKADFQKLTQDKAAVSKPPAGVVKPAPAPPNLSSTPKVWTADYVRRRAAKLLG